MKVTLNIDDAVMAELKREAARHGCSMSELVETALRLLLSPQRKREKVLDLPTFHSGGALVDIADRDVVSRNGRSIVLVIDTRVRAIRHRQSIATAARRYDGLGAIGCPQDLHDGGDMILDRRYRQIERTAYRLVALALH